MEGPRKKRRRGEVEQLSAARLETVLDEAILSKGTAELALLYLIDRYEFDLDALKAILFAKGLDVSFSNIKYEQISPYVGLDSYRELRDAPTFEIHRARIPNALFKGIIGDIEIVMKQYGPPIYHKNEEAQSRFIAPVFNRTIALFNLLISNTPESVMTGSITTKDRIEYQFKVFGLLTVVYIEIKRKLGTSDEYLNAVAQVIAEAVGCDHANSQRGFSAFPIYGILCDGKSFEFFCFDSSTKPPTFSRGHHSSAAQGRYALEVACLSSQSTIDFIASLRPVCETIFYFLLLGYMVGIRAEYQRSRSRGEESGESIDAWQKVYDLAEQAMQCALSATAHAAVGDYVQADKVATNATECLKTSTAATPAVYQWQECDIMEAWDEERINAA